MTIAQRYTKNPITIEAVQWDGGPESASRIIDWIIANGGSASYNCFSPAECKRGTHTIKVQTIEGAMDADPHWWIIRGVEGEFYPCKPSIFEATYSKAEDEGTRSLLPADRTQRLLENDDAKVWAEEFTLTFPHSGIEEGTMIGWFANAMQTQREMDAHRRAEVV